MIFMKSSVNLIPLTYRPKFNKKEATDQKTIGVDDRCCGLFEDRARGASACAARHGRASLFWDNLYI
jgi:hypothetical protein